LSHDRGAFANGRVNLFALQKKLKYPVARDKASRLAKELIKKSGLRHHINERYFYLLATCALIGRESLYNNFKPRRKHGKTKA
jgi:hypothetical protein